jgi:uncharacterized membrane protein
MRPLGVVGFILIIAGAVILALGGISYTKERESVEVGGVELAAERKGFVPPLAGVVVIVVGAVLVFMDRRRK